MSADDENHEQISRAFHQVFNSPDGEIVLASLADYCCASETCFASDPYDHARLAGRREVWLKIFERAKLMPEQALQLRASNVARMQQLVNQLILEKERRAYD